MHVAVKPQPQADTTDVRPLIQRNETNLWSHGEHVRDELYQKFSRVCESMGIEPLLLGSGPHVFPAWVQFEAWQPLTQPATTRRSSAVVVIEPKPYHRHAFECDVTYTTSKKTRTIKRVLPLSDDEVKELVQHLVTDGARPTFRRFRQAAFQFWRTKNKIEGLKTDAVSVALSVSIMAGIAMATAELLPVAVVLWVLAAILFVLIRRRKPIVRNDGKPDSEPRSLVRVDSWQTVLFGLGDESKMVRERLSGAFQSGLSAHCKFRPERLWYWGLDGKEEREQFVLRGGRGIVFCQVYRYGEDLYVGWDGHLNRGQWVEQTVTSGIDRESGNPVTVTRMVPGTQPTSEYDLADLSCLMEWTHAQIVKLLKQLIAEKRIDQEIDFKIERAERRQVVASGAAEADTGVTGRLRKTFQRTA